MRRSIIGATAVLAIAMGAACGDDTASTSTSNPAPGPISVEQLVARSADTPIDVEGFLHVSSGVAKMCAAILESYPPQCGEPAVELVGLDLADIAGTTTAGSITWKEGVVLTLQRAPDARFTVLGVAPG